MTQSEERCKELFEAWAAKNLPMYSNEDKFYVTEGIDPKEIWDAAYFAHAPQPDFPYGDSIDAALLAYCKVTGLNPKHSRVLREAIKQAMAAYTQMLIGQMEGMKVAIYDGRNPKVAAEDIRDRCIALLKAGISA